MPSRLHSTVSGADQAHLIRALVHALTSADSFDAMLEAAVLALGRGVGVQRVAVMSVDDGGHVALRASHGMGEAFSHAPLPVVPWAAGEPPGTFVTTDLARGPWPGAHAAQLRREGVQALAALPMVTRGRLVGMFLLYADSPLTLGESDLRFAQSVGELLTSVFARDAVERSLRESLATFETLAQQVPVGVMFENADDIIVFCNQRFCDLFGLPPAETLIGRSCLELTELVTCLSDPERFGAGLMAAKSGGEPVDGVEVTITGDRVYEQGMVPVHGPEGVSHRLWTYADVTERRRFAEHISRVEKMESLGALAGGVAHDFNNMLMSIIGYGDLARQLAEPNSTASNYLEQQLKVAEQAADLTRHLLTFARPRPSAVTRFRLADLVPEVLEMLDPLVGPEIAIRVDADLSEEQPEDRIEADRTQIHQVLMNLLFNARDAMPGGGRISIALTPTRLADGRDAVRLNVSDTGVGMDDETRRRAFEPLFSTKEAGRGTGLGLATCYGIVNRLAGEIGVTSSPGRGSTFSVILPSVTGADTEAKETEAAGEAIGPVHVLLVEDDEHVRIALGAYLQGLGWQVTTAATGEVGLERFIRGEFDIVVTDARMPGMSGYALTRQVQTLSPEIPVIVLSGYAERGDELPRGALFISKPIVPRVLGARIREQIAKVRGAGVAGAAGSDDPSADPRTDTRTDART